MPAAAATALDAASSSSCPWEADLKGLLKRIEGYLEGDGSGYDSLGNEYSELKALWVEMGLLPGPAGGAEKKQPAAAAAVAAAEGGAQEAQQGQQPEGRPAWYSQAFDYWEAERNCPANVDGVLGGFGHVSPKDIAGSVAFVEKLQAALPNLKLGRVVDCGAGIGRVTKHLLLPLFDKVDLLEQSPRLMAAAPAYLLSPPAAPAEGAEDGEEGATASAAASAPPPVSEAELRERVTYVCAGMQDFAPAAGVAYDAVWIQWCVGHLHDLDLLRFLQRCKRALLQGGQGPGQGRQGCVVVKDNCCTDVAFVLDRDDSSVTRSPAYLKALFRIAGFDLRLEERQRGFPKELLPVYMFAFTPRPF